MFAKTIKAQLIFIALTPLLLAVLFVSAFFLFESLDDIEYKLTKRVEDLSSQAVLMSEFSFYTGDIEELTTIAELMMTMDGVRYIRFINSVEQVLVQRGESNIDSFLRLVTVPVYAKNIEFDDFSPEESTHNLAEKLGSIEIGLSRDTAATQRQYVYIRGLIFASISLVIGIVLVYLFSRKLNSAMNTLMETATEIEEKNFNKRCDENGTGELLQFQKTFNHMAQTLQINEQELQSKIEYATRSLNDTVDELSRKNKELDKTRREAIELERSKAISDERTRIMRDMHDGVGGQLVASLALIEQEKDSAIKDNISGILSECLDDFRVIINSLNIHVDTLSVLLADFKYRMNKKLDNLDITLDWRVDDFADLVKIQPQQSLHILRILQEVFTNIFKHASASDIWFHAYEEDNIIQITIEDNGRFLKDLAANSGHGIKNMEWRATELRGSLSITQAPSGGCLVKLSFPVAALSP